MKQISFIMFTIGLFNLYSGGQNLRFKFVGRHTHIFVVLLEVDELLLQGFDLALQIHTAHVGVVDEFPQTDNICLHRLADGQFRLESKRHRSARSGLESPMHTHKDF